MAEQVHVQLHDKAEKHGTLGECELNPGVVRDRLQDQPDQ